MSSPVPQKGRCGAKLRKSELKFGEVRYCSRLPEAGRERCRLHGGASPRGIEHPRFTGRGYSRDIPTNLGARLVRSLEDPELLSLGAEIALMDARIGQIFQKMADHESETAFDRLKTGVFAVEEALINDRVDDAMEALKDMKKAVRAKDAELDGWREIRESIRERRALADTERKREEMLSGSMTARQVATFMAALQTAILEEVKDAETLRRLGIRLNFLLGLSADVPLANQRPAGRREIEQVIVDRNQFLPTVENAEGA